MVETYSSIPQMSSGYPLARHSYQGYDSGAVNQVLPCSLNGCS